MCETCWIDLGAPGRDELPPEYERFGWLHEHIYAESVIGSPLHTVLDDWNLADEQLSLHAVDDSPQAIAWAEEVITLMRCWTLRQRAAALAWAQGML